MAGFGAGYYLGAKAGRERYEQLNTWLGRVKGSDAYEVASDKAKAVVDLGVERAKDVIDEHTPIDLSSGSDGDGEIAVPSPS
jgi:hypothetical protein